MASNIQQLTIPEIYSSANDDIIYEFDFKPYAIDSVSNDGGFAKINLYDVFDILPNIGDTINVVSFLYSGTFKVLTVHGTSAVTIDTAYLGTLTSLLYNCYHYRIPTFSLYKGVIALPDALSIPLTKVLDFKPVIKQAHPVTGKAYLSINVKAVTKHLFNIVSNTVANSVDWSMVNAIRIRWDDQETVFNDTKNFTYVLNCTIKNEDLMLRIVHGIPLYPIDKPFINNSGVTFISIISTGSDYPIIRKFVNGVLV